MTIGLSSSGGWDKAESFLHRIVDGNIFSSLSHYGQRGVEALSAATPVDTGGTANSWNYEIVQDASSWSIIWGNSNVHEGRPIAVLLQYGHGTRTGGYVEGRDYINPALQPIFDEIADAAWKVVTA